MRPTPIRPFARALRPSSAVRAPLRASPVVRSGGHHHAPKPGTGIYAPKYGFAPYTPPRSERIIAQLLGGATWLWILFSFKRDGLSLIVCTTAQLEPSTPADPPHRQGLSNPFKEFEDEWEEILAKEYDAAWARKTAAEAEDE